MCESERDKGGRILPGKRWRLFHYLVEIAVESPKTVDKEEAAEDASDFAVSVFKGRMARMQSSFCSITNIREFDMLANLPFFAGMMVCNGTFTIVEDDPAFYIAVKNDSHLDFFKKSLKRHKLSFKIVKQDDQFRVEISDLNSVRKIVGIIGPYLWGEEKKRAELVHEFTELRKRDKDDKLTGRELRLVEQLNGQKRNPKKAKPAKPKKVRY